MQERTRLRTPFRAGVTAARRDLGRLWLGFLSGSTRCPVFILLTLLACTGADTPIADSATSATADDCHGLEAMFFDLGETLVTEGDDGLFSPMPSAQQLLVDLTERELTLGVITNVPAGWTRADLDALLTDPGILDPFELVLMSSEAVAPKPDPAIFEEAVGLLSGPTEIGRTAFVTESLDDIADKKNNPTEGARAAGMLGVHLSDDAPSEFADYTVGTADLATLADADWLDCLAQ